MDCEVASCLQKQRGGTQSGRSLFDNKPVSQFNAELSVSSASIESSSFSALRPIQRPFYLFRLMREE